MNWKQKRMIKVSTVLIVLVAAAYFLYPISESINLGLDLQGGTNVILEAQEDEDAEVDDQAMERIIGVINRRVDELGLTEPEVRRDGEKRIAVSLPGVEEPGEAIELIGQTAQLEFRDGNTGEVLMTGEYLEDASATRQQDQVGRSEAVIQFQLSDEGGRRFREITRERVGEVISIHLDDEELTSPTVQQELGDSGVITGYESIDEAHEDALLLRAGALPMPVEVIENRTMGPTLGEMSVQQSVQAGIIGLALIVIFISLSYKLSGIMASLALLFYSLLVLGVLAGLGATLTLPGIGGLILSIGMAVDANVIIFERIKYEYREGKSLKGAIDSGFKRAYMTILDSNITTLITAAILAYFSTGVVRGFAITLSIGILASMFTAILVTRLLVDTTVSMSFKNKAKLFGLSRG